LKDLKGRDNSEDLAVVERIILECIVTETGWEGVQWINMAPDMGQRRAVINTKMKVRVA
jgi:hypothetical protein